MYFIKSLLRQPIVQYAFKQCDEHIGPAQTSVEKKHQEALESVYATLTSHLRPGGMLNSREYAKSDVKDTLFAFTVDPLLPDPTLNYLAKQWHTKPARLKAMARCRDFAAKIARRVSRCALATSHAVMSGCEDYVTSACEHM